MHLFSREFDFAVAKKWIVPVDLPRLVAFVDPNSKVKWWAVCAFGNGFTGHVVSFGTWPDQGLTYFANRDIRKTIAKALPKAGRQAQVFNALENIVPDLLDRDWILESGATVRIEKMLIDANWGSITDTVYRYVRSSRHAGKIIPSHGQYLGPADKTINQWPQKPGDRFGPHWRERFSQERACRYVSFDANRWKSTVVDRFRTAVGDPGALTIFQDTPSRLRMFVDHMCSEKTREEKKRGNRMTVFEEQRGVDNDLWDCVVGCHVGASMLGIELPVKAGGRPAAPKKKKKRRKRVSALEL